MGLTLGIVAAPCLGPFILGLLTHVGQRGDPFLGFLYFFVLSIGMGLPLSILAVFSGLLDRFPLSGDWMVWIKKLFGWILFGMAAYMIGPLTPDAIGGASDAIGGASGIMAVLAVAAGIHLGWIDTTTANRPLFVYFKRALGAGLIAVGLLLFLSTRFHAGGIQWTPYDKVHFRALLKEKKPVILDFYADWCTPCRAMEQEVFAHPEVLKLSDRIRFVRLDLTRRKPSQQDLLRRYDIKGIPTILFFEPTGAEAKGLRIEAYVDRDVFLEKARQLLKDPGGG
jgi:thiol:disulfide interchange protein DsbD